ncbi:MAG: hypothetical protein HOW73_43005 [Polyangiaceae bacterium]|nr:hypothetical protein [Polyangiaceae bacterium]
MACNRDPRPEKEEVASSISSVTVPVAPDFSWARFPKKLTYMNHVRRLDGSRESMPTQEESAERVSSTGERRLSVKAETKAAHPDQSATVSTEWVINAEGLFQLSDETSYPGEKATTTTYDPPKLTMPAVVPERPWTFKRYDGVIAEVTASHGSPFCADGVRTITRHVDRRGKQGRSTSHWCPGTGWRGQDTYYVEKDGSKAWTWTTGLVADGTSLADAPLSERLPEVPADEL